MAPTWNVRLFDKRESYARTHRLRLDPKPYLAIADELGDPRFDAIVTLLRETGFTPEVNVLEAALSELALALGVAKEKREIASRAELVALRREHGEGGMVTIVGADSVHSVVREIVRGDVRPMHATHERLARLRVRGEALPSSLGLVDRVRISKVLGSIVDYRLNRNGYAEVDLFLTDAEHAAVKTLGATPRAPVAITARTLGALRAPLFRAIVEHLEDGLGAHHAVEVQSSFELEHTVTPRLVYELEGATTFLVGDAAVSLPFFRGMASLASCAHALAHVHVDLACPVPEDDAAAFRARHPVPLVGARPLPGTILEVHHVVHRGAPAHVVLHRWLGRYGVHVVREDGVALRVLRSVAPVRESVARAELDAQRAPARRYEVEAGEIVRRELGIVRARARLIAATREAFRVAAMLPFPIQTWLLRARELHPERDRATPGLFVNASIALVAASLALAGSTLEARGGSALWLAIGAHLVELVGGAAYRGALALEAPPHRFVARTWALQIGALFVGGVALAVPIASHDGMLAALPSLSWWLSLAAAFVLGMLLFERVARRELAQGGYDADVPPA